MRTHFVHLILGSGLLLALAIGADESLTEAPAGFDTPTLAARPGSESSSNGIAEPPGDSFAPDQQAFETPHDATTGLGPVYNATSCSGCHQNPVTDGPSQITEIRAGHRDENGNFVNPSVSINDGANVIICPQAQEHLPESENVRSLRAVLNTLGDGFVEAVDDSTLLAIADSQPDQSHGLIRGEAIQVPILEAPGQTRVGRFGWKDQHGSLLSFAADAYVNEMGVTSRLRMVDPTSVCKVTSDPEDRPDALGLADIDHFAQFVRGTKVPPRDTLLATTPDAMAGQKVFESVGCNICHVESMTTAPQRTPVNGGMFLVPEALGNKIIHPFGDFLLHQIGTGDGIVQVGPEDTAAKLRTAPLWGLRTKSRFMHDLASLTLEDAIYRHRGEARRVAHDFRALPSVQQQQLIRFLKSL